jgi:hypothetical protein
MNESMMTTQPNDENLIVAYNFFSPCVLIDLVLIDQQSVGKRSLHLMDTVNTKKRWTAIYWRVNKFLKKSPIVTCIAKTSFIFEN